MAKRYAGLLAALIASACSHSADYAQLAAWEERQLAAVTSPELTRFASEGEFRAYLALIDQLQTQWRSWPFYAQGGASDDVERIVVTASRVTAPTITNVQTAGVDEGDVVKRIGPFLLILQDGRVYAVDTRGGLALADRIDVYRDPQSDAWYDEMLVQDDYIIVTSYSYDESASEISILTLDRESGKLRSEGVFLITSDDYYSVENYATRIVDGHLVIHTAFDAEDYDAPGSVPTIRRWLPEGERTALTEAGAPLWDAEQIYRPVQHTLFPTVHSISLCPIGDRARTDLRCETTSFVAPQSAEMFVSTDDVFLWTWRPFVEIVRWRACGTGERSGPLRNAAHAAIFRLSLTGNDLRVAGARGAPFDQFSMDSRDGEFRALANWTTARCYEDGDSPAPPVALARIPDNAFSSTFTEAADSRFTPLPAPDQPKVENRFADDWLIYGSREYWWSYPPEPDEPSRVSEMVAVPVRAPERPLFVDVPHDVNRIERLGSDIILTGYHDDAGLRVSLLRLGHAPYLAATAQLDGRFESEGRSHAFNAAFAPDGAAVMGIPTVPLENEAGRLVWRSDASDLSFFAVSAGGRIAPLGELLTTPPALDEDGWPVPDADYVCEVSCTDWYGNSRPIFFDGRIFGLMGFEIVEATVEDGAIREIGRLDIAHPHAAPRS